MKMQRTCKPEMEGTVICSRFELFLDQQVVCRSSELNSVTVSEHIGKWSKIGKTDSSGSTANLHPSLGIN